MSNKGRLPALGLGAERYNDILYHYNFIISNIQLLLCIICMSISIIVLYGVTVSIISISIVLMLL